MESVVRGIEVHRFQLRPPLALLLFSFLRMGVTAFGGSAMIAYI